LLEMAGPKGSLATHEQRPAESLTKSRPGAAAALLTRRDLTPMMNDVSLATILTAAGFVALAAIYLWSKDPARQARARDLLKLLFGR
jgi:hypothetical protein